MNYLHLLLLLVSFSCIAQTTAADLFDSPDIVWIGESQSDLRFSDLTDGDTTDLRKGWNEFTREKSLIMPRENGFAQSFNGHKHQWECMILEWMTIADCFYDSLLSKPVLQENKEEHAIERYSVLITENGKLVDFPMSMHVSPSELVGIRVHQLIYWDKRSQNLGYYPISFAPLLGRIYTNDEFDTLKSLIWFPVTEETDPKGAWQKNEVTFIAETRHDIRVQGVGEIQARKGRFMAESFFSAIRDDNSSELLDWLDYNSLGDSFRETLFTSYADTITFTDCHPYQGGPFIIYNKFSWDSLQSLQLINRWFWDEKNFILTYQFVGFAVKKTLPADQFGEKWEELLFYRRTE